MRKQNLPLQRIMSQDSISEVASAMRYEDVSALYAAIGEGHVSTQSVIEKILAGVQTEAETDEPELAFPRQVTSRQLRNSDSGVLVRGRPTSSSSSPSAAPRCPATRSSFITRGQGVSVHQARART